jgi:microcin C transport system ATP-binding protein
MNTATTVHLLDVKNLRIAFGGNEVVHGIDFSIAAGEKVALVGESGSGKTVTALSLLRLVQDAQVDGQAIFQGASQSPGQGVDLLHLPDRAVRAIRGQDIAMIFQEPMTALNPLMTVGSQIAEVLEEKKAIAPVLARKLAIDLIANTGILEPERRAQAYPHQLSGGQRQRAMIAMALACQPKLLLADEPTTALDVTVRAQILDLIATLQKDTGMAVLMITHDLNLVRRFADRVVIMEKGHVVEHGPVSKVFANPQNAYTRKLINSEPARDVLEVSGDTFGAGEPQTTAGALLTARGLRVSYATPKPGFKGWFSHGEFVAVKGVDFQLGKGQTLGVVGESGSGKSTLALAALGLLPHEGELLVAGQAWHKGAQGRPLRQLMQVVFQDPFSSLSPRLTVQEIVGEGLLVHQPGLDVATRQAKVAAALVDVGMDDAQFPGLLQRYPHEFSGGQRQRLAIARALIVDPQLLVLDEPTSALDVTIQKQVLELLQRLQRERGLSYLLITHDVAVIRAMAHQVIVMRNAEIVESGSLAQVFNNPQHEYTRTLLAASA